MFSVLSNSVLSNVLEQNKFGTVNLISFNVIKHGLSMGSSFVNRNGKIYFLSFCLVTSERILELSYNNRELQVRGKITVKAEREGEREMNWR